MRRIDAKNNLVCLRTNRMFKAEEGWFFKTREGHTIGPFRDELEASTQLEVYIRLVTAGLLPMQEDVPLGRVAANSAN